MHLYPSLANWYLVGLCTMHRADSNSKQKRDCVSQTAVKIHYKIETHSTNALYTCLKGFVHCIRTMLNSQYGQICNAKMNMLFT